MSVRVLVVCTANICRSPIMQALLEVRAGALDIEVSGAGTHAIPDRPINPYAAAALAEFGVDAGGYRATRLTPGLVEDADLVLTAAVEHRRVVLTASPRAIRRTFTLREFARLSGAVHPSGELRDRIAEVAARRGREDAVAPGQDDIADPYGAPYPVMQRCAQEIDVAVRSVATLLGTVSSA